MIIIIWNVMKNYRDFIRHIKFLITNIMCFTSMFTCIVAMISTFSVIYALESFFKILFPQIQHTFASWCDFNSSIVNGSKFFFSKPVLLFERCLKDVQNFFIQSFSWSEICLSSMRSNPQIVDIEYLEGICSPIFVVAEFSELFAHTSTF